ncbi:MAG: hemolysin family protein [Ignavibacteriales bacterium]|nr:hemolysin family protein [Ignavibacteriales bacterium]
MDYSLYSKILLLLICFLFSAFFSGSEVALFSFNKKKIREFKKEHRIIGGYIQLLLDHPKRLLVTILLGNTIVNVAASIISVVIALEIASTFKISVGIALFVQITLLTILILLLGETTPKLWAQKYPLQFAKLVAIPLYWISIIFYPVSKILTDLLVFVTSRFNFDKSKSVLQGTEITDLADLSIEKGTIEEGEHELIHGIVSFKTVTAREIMTPRVDITAISIDESFDELMKIINESGHSRIPLYENSLDKISGIIYAKDILPFLKNPESRKTLSFRNIAREALFVPETKLINELLHEFQEKNMHLGIVVDEYGGTSGLISLEDILEEVVGEIRDEYDKEENEISKLSDTSYMILGKVSIDELNDLLGKDYSSENDDYDTIGGFIFNHAGSIPKQGFHFIHNNYKFTVTEVVNNRINKVLVEKITY